MISDDQSREWVKRFPDVLRHINKEKVQITGIEPINALKLKNVKIC